MNRLKVKGIVFDSSVLSNLPIIIALIMLGSAPFFLLQNELETANQNASYAFYLLVIGVLWKIMEQLMTKHLRKK